MLQSRSVAARKALLGAMLLRTSPVVALAAETPAAAPTQTTDVKLSLSRSCSRVEDRRVVSRWGASEPGRAEGGGRERAGASGARGGGTGERGDGRDARLATQQKPALTARPTVGGLNTARGRAGRVGCERGETRPSRQPLVGAAGRAGAGRRGNSPRLRRKAAFGLRCAKWESAQRGSVVEAVAKGAQRNPWVDTRLCLQLGEAWGKENGMK